MGRGSFRVNLGRSVVTNWAFVTCSSQITLRTCFKYADWNQSVNPLHVACTCYATYKKIVTLQEDVITIVRICFLNSYASKALSR